MDGRDLDALFESLMIRGMRLRNRFATVAARVRDGTTDLVGVGRMHIAQGRQGG